MKSTITLGIALAAGTLGSLGAAPQALAVPFTNTSGTICKNDNAGEANFIDYVAGKGTRSIKNGRTEVICPLTRDTQNSDGAFVHVFLTHNGNRTTTCTAFSHDHRGTLLASNSETFTGPDFAILSISLDGAGKSDAYSDYSVRCGIPGNSQGVILGVDLEER
jgi:hypothetical protein